MVHDNHKFNQVVAPRAAAMPAVPSLLKQIITVSSSLHVTIDLANVFVPIWNCTGRITIGLILRERDRDVFMVLPQGYVNFPVPCPNSIYRDFS